MAAPSSQAPASAPLTIRAALVLLGFTAAVAQIVLMRELLVLFYGNELSLGLMLACWLLWTAFGSSVLARVAAGNRPALAAALLAGLAFVLPLTIFALRSVNLFFHRLPGEILGPGAILVASLAVLAPFCSLTGWLFAAGSRCYGEETQASVGAASSSAYLLDAAGSTLGGLLASLLLIRAFNASQIALLLALLNLLGCLALALRSRRNLRLAVLLIAAAGGAVTLPLAAARLESASLARLWHGFRVVASRNSIYGNLTVVETEGARTLFENGSAVSSGADPAAAEEAVHYALLQHPAPRSLLLIGGGFNGSLAQALKHRTLERVDYVELDPTILLLTRDNFAEAWAPVRADARVRIHNLDGRLFLKTTSERFDVIIANLPDPHTAQLNRFYTLEFFREAAAKLMPSGVFSFQVAGSENYISAELADFLRCINKTLRSVFPAVTLLPGEQVHFFAAAQPWLLAADAAPLLARLRERQLDTAYVREYYLPFRMTPERVRDLESQIAAQPATPVNHDFGPIACYLDVVLWTSRFHGVWDGWFASAARLSFAWLLSGAAVLLLAIALFVSRSSRRGVQPRRERPDPEGRGPQDALFASSGGGGVSERVPSAQVDALARNPSSWRTRDFWSLAPRTEPVPSTGGEEDVERRVSAFCVAAMGFTLMALELLLLLAFQALYGYVYHQLAILIAGVMAGLAGGTWLALAHCRQAGPPARRDFIKLAVLQAAAALSALVLCLLFALLARVHGAIALSVLAQLLFPILAMSCGLLAGYQFPVASRVFFAGRAPEAGGGGILYAIDLVGACLGALLLSAYLVPVFGFLKTASLLALVNLVPAALALKSALSHPPSAT